MKISKLFGTDGIRDHVSTAHLSPESILRLGHIVAQCCLEQFFGATDSATKTVVIGRDTRDSGAYMESSLVAGLSSRGIHCVVLGVVPTAVVAYYTRLKKASCGIMISASHNPYHDNGLKIFDSAGFKIDEAQEARIEHDFFNYNLAHYPVVLSPGVIERAIDAQYHYFDELALSFSASLLGLTIVVDCANGSASHLAPAFFKRLGAHVIAINQHQPGRKINHSCGSEDPQTLMREVLNHQADVGIAFDGDADRVIFVDEAGALLDGDGILAVMAIDLKRRGQLQHNTLVATIMSSIALDRALIPHDIKVVRTGVGDKYVARAMRDGGFSFGGENSGHMIVFPHATTGDALSSACFLLSILKQSGLHASQLLSFFIKTPRLLKNFIVEQKIPLHHLPKTNAAIETVTRQLGSGGRILFRYSGTENKARLLVEAESEQECARIAEELGHKFLSELHEKCEQSVCESCA